MARSQHLCLWYGHTASYVSSFFLCAKPHQWEMVLYLAVHSFVKSAIAKNRFRRGINVHLVVFRCLVHGGTSIVYTRECAWVNVIFFRFKYFQPNTLRTFSWSFWSFWFFYEFCVCLNVNCVLICNRARVLNAHTQSVVNNAPDQYINNNFFSSFVFVILLSAFE